MSVPVKQSLAVISIFAIAFLSFGATAAAQNAVLPEDGALLDLARPVWDAIVHGNYFLAAALGVIFLTAAAKKHLPDAWGGRLVRSELGGMATAFVLAFAGALANTWAAPGAAMTMAVLLAALKIGAFAVGGWMILHKVALVLVGTKFWQDKMPASVKALVAIILKLIGSSAIKKAEAAGQKAVDANPPTGLTGVVGEPTRL